MIVYRHLFAAKGYQIQICHCRFGIGSNSGAIFFGFTNIAILFQSLPVQIAESFLPHGGNFFRQFILRQQRKTNKQSCNIAGYIATAGHSFIPAPSTVFTLQFFQFGKSGKIAVIQLVDIEQHGNTCLLFSLSSSFQYPRRLAEQDILHTLILLQPAEEGFFRATDSLPTVKYSLNPWLAVGNEARQTIGIPSGSPRNGIIIARQAQCRQSLHGIPSRIPGEFHSQTTVCCCTAITIEKTV